MKTFASPEELRATIGGELGASDWLTVTQEQVDAFAEATGDRQWIHVDLQRAKEGPFGGTIAHGYLTLALLPQLVSGIYQVENAAMVVNYGLNKVRFISPVRVGSAVRAVASVTSVDAVSGGVQVALTALIELQGSDKPAAVAETLTRYFL